MTEKICLITGASRGIGRALADDLTARGYRVIGLSRSAPDDGFPGEHLPVDLADAAATAAALDEATARGDILYLVNNAGLVGVQPLGEIAAADLQAMVAVNLQAALLCAQGVLPQMRRVGFGRIVNIGSRAALGKSGRSVYGATKAALASFTRTWALELADAGITVNCVAPGPIETEMIRQNYPRGSEARAALVGQVPMRRMGESREIAAACAYFLSDEAGFVTGQTLYVCGGLSLSAAP